MTATIRANKKSSAKISKADRKRRNREIVFSVGMNIQQFVDHLDSLANSFPLVNGILREVSDKEEKSFESFLQAKATNSTKRNRKSKHAEYKIKGDLIVEVFRLLRNASVAHKARRIVPSSLFVSLVSQYDGYLGRLLRTLFHLRPELITGSDRTLTLSDLMTLKSIENGRRHIVEKEIEGVIRKSHAEQFDWLENRFGIPLKKELGIWPTFIELTERRNLFVHCDGIVSAQYLDVCAKHRAQPGGSLGERLLVTDAYFQSAYACLFEIGIKLGQVLWRKLQPDALRHADSSLVQVCFTLLSEDKHELAKPLLFFATDTLKRHGSEENRLIFIVNQALAYKMSNDKAQCNEILDKEDWSAARDRFRLPVAVLREQYDVAGQLMKKIGRNGDVSKADYKAWPLFFKFRGTKVFKKTYKAVFGEEFTINVPRTGK